jgi:acyl-CoA synthetase (AMP-forming)/AMP-acid ligase II
MLHLQFGIGTGDLILCILPNCLTYPMILLAGPICGAPIAGAPPDSSIGWWEK